MYKEEKELWVKFACAALSGVVVEEGWGNGLKEIAESACEFADIMLDKYKEKFENC